MGRRKRKQKPSGLGAGRVMFDIETSGAPYVIDFKTADGKLGQFKAMDFARAEQKMAAHAAAYGMGTSRIRGLNPTAVHHDEIQYTWDPAEHFVDPDCKGLNDDEWRWAVAFRKVLGVGHEFYEYAPPSRREWLEQHYRELASHDTPKGRKAAKVVAVYVEFSLARRTPRASDWVPDPQSQFYGTVTGRMSGGPVPIHNLPKVKP